MIAFLLAIPGLKRDGHPYLHSQMLGVLPEYRNTGIGKRLKLHQKEDALARGYDLIEWTFDPLQLKNAWFNIEGLGAIVRRYIRNQYGTSTSVLQGGLPTDRCVAEWWVNKPRVRPDIVERVPVPASRSRAVQEEIADRFEACFARGLAVVGVQRDGSGIEYLFGVAGMKIERVILRQIRMPLVHFFETSFSRTYERNIIIVEVAGEGLSGWGEITAGENPFYNEEWTASAWLIAKDYVAPRVIGKELASAADVDPLTRHIRGHNMARGGVEAAVWDLQARQNGNPLWKEIGGGARTGIPCGVSIGIQDSVEQLIGKIETELAAGYQRIKMKIKPGWDVDVIRRVRERFPKIRLMADANSAYTLDDAARLKQLDEFYLMMIEQPLAHDDIIDHAQLQQQIETPVCLDECIRSVHHAEQAIRLKAGRIVNIKLGRVGGFAEARRVHDVCEAAGIPVWCGGMLEAGIGRAHNIALATLPNFTLPGDVSASSRYWKRDIISPAVEITPRGTIAVRDEPGFGYEIDHDFLKSVTVRMESVS